MVNENPPTVVDVTFFNDMGHLNCGTRVPLDLYKIVRADYVDSYLVYHNHLNVSSRHYRMKDPNVTTAHVVIDNVEYKCSFHSI